MKLFRKMTVLVLAVVMVMSLAAGVSATDIHINSTISGATYNGYRLLDTTTSLKVQGCHEDEKDHLSTCYNIAYSIVNEDYYDILETQTGKTSEAEIIEYIRSLTTAESIRDFADDVYAAITSKGLSADKTVVASGDNATLNGVASGYWLIVENISDGTYPGAYSLVILDTAGSRDVTVATKRDEPTLNKYVRDNGMSYGKGADIQIGDLAEFLLITDVPNPIGYDQYTYLIHDEMCEGLDFTVDSVQIRLNSLEGTELAKTYYSVTSETDDPCDFHIVVDIKKATAAGVLKGDDRLYITYTAKLNEKANILVNGQDTKNANSNLAWLEYSNDPYDETDTAVSAKENVYVWTFPLELNKVDNASTPLSGAKFVLSTNKELVKSDLEDGSDEDTLPDGHSKMIALIDKGSNVYLIAPSEYEGSVVYEVPVGSAQIQGFDDQVEYYLYETAAPAGYNKLNAPVSVKFFASYQSSESPLMASGYPKVSINTESETGELKANIVNQTGAELPSTGGIGTTIFYILGGAMVLAAVVLLITKKRMGADS